MKMGEVLKFILAVVLIGTVWLLGSWADQYENILPLCTKYKEENYFWICRRNSKVTICDNSAAYQINDGCIYYKDKTVCGSFEIERAQGVHCESWKPWFNRKKSEGGEDE